MGSNDTKHALDLLALTLEQRPELVLSLRDALIYIDNKGGDVDTFFNQWRDHVIATEIEAQRRLQVHTKALEASTESNLAYINALKESAEYAKSYASHVLIIGYFGFFSLWYFVSDKEIISTFSHSLIGFLMTISIMLFLLFDVVIRIWKEKDTPDGKTLEYWLSAVIPTIFGYAALSILGVTFLIHLFEQIIK